MGRPDLPGGVMPSTGEVPPDRQWIVSKIHKGSIGAPTAKNAAHIAAEVMGPGDFRCAVNDEGGQATYSIRVVEVGVDS